MSGMAKEKTKFFFFIPECRLYYSKIVQMNGMTKEKRKFFFFIPEFRLYYSKIVQMSGMTKEKRKFFFCHSRVPPILFKDSANEWNDKRKMEN